MTSPVCLCIRFSTGRGWTYDPERDLWVCSGCKKPSQATYDRLSNEETDQIMATNNVEQFLNDLADLLAKHGFGSAGQEQSAAPAKGRAKVATAKPAPEPEDDDTITDADDAQADRRAELGKMTLVALRKALVKAGFDPDDVAKASKKEMIESLLEDEAKSDDDEDESDDEDQDDETDDADEEEDEEDDTPSRDELMKLSLVALKKLARTDYEIANADMAGLDKEAIVDLILGEPEEEDADEGSDEEEDDEEEGLTEEQMLEMSLKEIKDIAAQYNVKVRPGMRQRAIVAAIMKAASE